MTTHPSTDPFDFVSVTSPETMTDRILQELEEQRQRKRQVAPRRLALPDVFQHTQSYGEAGTLSARRRSFRADAVLSVNHGTYNIAGIYWYDRKKRTLFCCLYELLEGWHYHNMRRIFPLNLLLTQDFISLEEVVLRPFMEPNLEYVENFVKEMFTLTQQFTLDFEAFLINPFSIDDVYPKATWHGFRYRTSAFPGIVFLQRAKETYNEETTYQAPRDRRDINVLLRHLHKGTLRLYHRDITLENIRQDNEGCIFCYRLKTVTQQIEKGKALDPDFLRTLFGGETDKIRGLGLYPFSEAFRSEIERQLDMLNRFASGEGEGLPLFDTTLLQRLSRLLGLRANVHAPEGLRLYFHDRPLPVLMTAESTTSPINETQSLRISETCVLPVYHAECHALSDHQLIDVELFLMQPAQLKRPCLQQLREKILMERRKREVLMFAKEYEERGVFA